MECPSYECTFFLQEREVRELADDNLYQKYLDQAITIAERSVTEKNYHCKTPNCKGFTFLENNPEITEFPCPICNFVNCLKCDLIHADMTCEQYKEKLANEQLQQTHNENNQATTEYLQVCFDFQTFFYFITFY